MSISGRGLIAPSFADFLTRGDVYLKIQENAKKVASAPSGQRYSKLTRLFDGLPEHPTTIPILNTCEKAIARSKKPNELSFENSTNGSVTAPTLSDECNIWLDYVFASAIYELFDKQGNLRREIRNYFETYFNDLKSTFSDKELKRGLFAAYMEDIIGSHVAQLAGKKTTESNPFFTNQIFLCSTAIQTKLQALLDKENIDFNEILKQLYQDLLLKYRKDAIRSDILKAEVRRIMYSSFYQLAWTDFHTTKTQYTVHLFRITLAERKAKETVSAEVDAIKESLTSDPIRTQLEKLSILTQVLVQTQAYTPQADEETQKSYNQLIVKVSEHAWGKRLGAAMSAVPIAALLATFILFSVATGGAAIPFLVTLSFAAMLGISIATGVSAVGALLVAGYLLWQGFKHKPIADAMKTVRDAPAPKRGATTY